MDEVLLDARKIQTCHVGTLAIRGESLSVIALVASELLANHNNGQVRALCGLHGISKSASVIAQHVRSFGKEDLCLRTSFFLDSLQDGDHGLENCPCRVIA